MVLTITRRKTHLAIWLNILCRTTPIEFEMLLFVCVCVLFWFTYAQLLGIFSMGFSSRNASVCHKASSWHGQFPLTTFMGKMGVVFPPSASRIQSRRNLVIPLFETRSSICVGWKALNEMPNCNFAMYHTIKQAEITQQCTWVRHTHTDGHRRRHR